MAESGRMRVEHSFLSDLEEAFRALVGDCASIASFAAGQYLFHEGEPARWFYLIRHGRVALEVVAPGRGPLTFQTLGEGDVLGMFWMTPQSHWTHDARAVQPTEAIAIESACLREKCEGNPALGYDLLKRFVPILLGRLESVQLQMLDVYGHAK